MFTPNCILYREKQSPAAAECVRMNLRYTYGIKHSAYPRSQYDPRTDADAIEGGVASSFISSTMSWQTLCAERKRKQLESIPKEWLITPAPEEQRNVIDVPELCGLLTDREVQITSTVDVEVLLGKLALGEWSSVEATTAFYKRAIIAQQLVRLALFPLCILLS